MSEEPPADKPKLPRGWQKVCLPQIARVNPALDRGVAGDTVVVNFVPMRAVEPEGGGLLRPEVRPYGEVKKGYTAFLSGDVIMAKITPCMENGKTTVVPELPGSVCFGSTEFHVMRPENGVEARWIANFLLQHEVRRAAQRAMGGGVGQMRVPSAFLETAEIPLPPTAEQLRIADALDELLSDLDAGVAGIERVLAKLGQYRAAVLKAAVQGALTADWRKKHRKVEPASALHTRILAERRRRWEEDQLRKFKEAGKEPPKNWKARFQELAAPDTTDLPPLPEGWCWATVEQLAAHDANAITDGPFGSKLKTEHYCETGPRVIRLQNIKDGYFADEKAHIPQTRFEELKKHKIEAGDIVIAGLSDSPPRACIIPATVGPAIVKADCIRFKPHQSVSPTCLNFFLNSAPTRGRMKIVVHGVGRPRLNLGEIKAIVLPLPPPDEQDEIAETVEDQLSVLDHLEADLEAKLKSAQALRQSILRHAFTGQLVPQDPKDEPAAELLKRIAAERGARARQALAARRAVRAKPSPGAGNSAIANRKS